MGGGACGSAKAQVRGVGYHVFSDSLKTLRQPIPASWPRYSIRTGDRRVHL